MKILIFGGSFDPPHEGHLRLLKAGIKALRPEKTFVLPSFHSPFKKEHQAPAADRREMARLLARAAGRGVRVDDLELARGRRTYTYEAVRDLRRRFPKAELWLLMGSDAAASLKDWKRYPELKREAGFVIGRRPGTALRTAGLKKIVLPGTFPDLSSTAARARLIAGAGAKATLATAFAFIKRRGLYGTAAQAALEASLKPQRYRHTLSVARLAAELALRHGLDPEEAAWAGLLHDAGRRYDPGGMIRFVTKRRVRVPLKSQVIRRNPLLLHAYVSGELARTEFGVASRAVIEAIRNHTLGKRGMGKLDRLLFVADISSEDRGFSEAKKIRSLAEKDIEKAFDLAVTVKREYVLRNAQWRHPAGEALWRWVRSRRS